MDFSRVLVGIFLKFSFEFVPDCFIGAWPRIFVDYVIQHLNCCLHYQVRGVVFQYHVRWSVVTGVKFEKESSLKDFFERQNFFSRGVTIGFAYGQAI